MVSTNKLDIDMKGLESTQVEVVVAWMVSFLKSGVPINNIEE